jgi:hypothetical protein
VLLFRKCNAIGQALIVDGFVDRVRTALPVARRANARLIGTALSAKMLAHGTHRLFVEENVFSL